MINCNDRIFNIVYVMNDHLFLLIDFSALTLFHNESSMMKLLAHYSQSTVRWPARRTHWRCLLSTADAGPCTWAVRLCQPV